ncbi:F-box protein pof6 [Grifola frondosa]|uniref:F-box protein pof6 n=1 Tax=Grifola frondosa TaxID=5627 RepID=A0A1C7LNW7_GRIFR|nr:F-box protein pof6 [Grifola frondosa]
MSDWFDAELICIYLSVTMEKFATLEPVRLYASSAWTSANGSSSRASHRSPRPHPHPSAVPDIPLMLAPLSTCQFSRDERVWEARWKAFGVDKLGDILNDLEEKAKSRMLSTDDEFGDFVVQHPSKRARGLCRAFTGVSIHNPLTSSQLRPRQSYLPLSIHSRPQPHQASHPALSSPPHTVLSALFPAPAQSLRYQAHILHLLSLFLSSRVKPLHDWAPLGVALRAAIDRFEDRSLTAFDIADGKGDEQGMQEAAKASWEVWDGSGGTWELGRTWAEKLEIFYQQGKWEPLDNFTNGSDLDFDAMDAFMNEILSVLKQHGSQAVRVFPPEANVLLSFSDRLASEVVGEYISVVLTRAREVSNEAFLKATAATFKEAWRMVDIIIDIATQGSETAFPKTKAEDVVYYMFESNMDEYLDEEVEFVQQCFEITCRSWEPGLLQLSQAVPTTATREHARFLGSHNPAQVKRNVLASFTDVLLLPVTIVPRTVGKAVGAAITSGSTAAVQGVAMLNPQRWGATSGLGHSGVGTFGRLSLWGSNGKNGYTRDLDNTLFEIGDDELDEADKIMTEKDRESERTARSSVSSSGTLDSLSTVPTSAASTRISTPAPPLLDNLDLLLSLDTALELIHADRESLKRAEIFSGYPGQYGHRVRDTIEEIFVVLLQALSDRHIRPGFQRATEQMKSYKPAEHEETKSVAPLLQFFELVHIGDTMQSMMQVYFDKELAPHIDRTDFLNTVVREKKRFEDVLDDCVAAGLNAATDALMNRCVRPEQCVVIYCRSFILKVEHIILKLTKPREYYPSEDDALELGPTQGCREAIKCLQMHCQLLKGSTSKEVLEVFYQEVAFARWFYDSQYECRILQKHIKRQIISLNGGFQIIADLNAYYTFISSLRVASITSEFSCWGMLFVVEDARDLAQIVRDVTRYGGAYRPEDVYEFIQRRSDWKKIEKTVDKTMYNLSFKEIVLYVNNRSVPTPPESRIQPQRVPSFITDTVHSPYTHRASTITNLQHPIQSSHNHPVMSLPEFSLRLQRGIVGGFAPPTPDAVYTITFIPTEGNLHITRAERPEGTPSLQDAAPKAVPLDDATNARLSDLYTILKEAPGSQDIYELNTSIAFGSEGFMWMNGGPQGCVQGESEVKPTDAQKADFEKAVKIVQDIVNS